MKRYIAAFLIVLLLAVGIVGCGGGNGGKETGKDDGGQTATRLSDAFVKMMNDGKYLMEVVTTTELDGQSVSMTMTMAVDGDNVAIISESAGIKSTMVSKGDKLYVIDDANKMVFVMNESVGEVTAAARTSEVSGLKFEKSGQEGGLQFEQYASDSGKVLYYFEGSTLKKIRYVAEDGSESEMEIIRMTKDVPATMFEIPAGYQQFTM